MTYPEVKQELLKNPELIARRPHWDICRKIRSSRDSDYDFFQNCDLAGVIIEDCPKPCDCHTSIFQATEEEIKAVDYNIITC